MGFLHTMVRVTDIDASLKFYCDGLGLTELRRVENEKGRFTLVFLASPEDVDRFGYKDFYPLPEGLPMIELTYNWPDENGVTEDYGSARNFGHLAYRVSDIYAACARFQDIGVTINRPPRDGNMAFVRSPDGISIELLQRGDALPPRAPWKDMDNSGSW